MSFLSSLFNKSKGLDERYTDFLSAKYGLDESVTASWLMAYGSTTLASRKVKLFRMYDPALLEDSTQNMSYDKLEATPGAVMFEGQLASDGNMGQFKDMREKAEKA